MAIIYHWRRENYVEDIGRFNPAAGLELEQNSPTFAEAGLGERLWAFTRRPDGTYVLAAQLRVGRVEETGPGAQYGRYRIFPQPGTTVLYDVQQGHDAEDLIRSLSVRADAAVLGQSFQGGSAVRRLSGEDDARLEVFAAGLPVLYSGADGSPDEEDARYWAGLLRNAEEALASGTVFGSPKQGRPYRVAAVEPERVVIQRIDSPGSEVLTRAQCNKAISQVQEAGGRVRRRSLSYTVAKETTLVALHPALRWDRAGDWIELVPWSAEPGLTETSLPAPPCGGRPGKPASGRPPIDHAEQDARNRRLGRAGELLVLEHERMALKAAGREDLLERVVDVAGKEGDAAGYDIRSVTTEGLTKFIEVKTTRGPARTPLYMSGNELQFAKGHAPQYYLYRLYDCVPEANSAHFYIHQGDPEPYFTAIPIQFRMTPSAREGSTTRTEMEVAG